jgi:hypothetical protein
VELMGFGGNMGVVEMAGLLRAVGSMSPGILGVAPLRGLYSATCKEIKSP